MLYIKKGFGANRNWDVRKTAANQVYLGVGVESAQVWRAVNGTYGRVLVCRQGGAEEVLPAYYSSVCGGHTEDSQNVFGDTGAGCAGGGALVGVSCLYCKDVSKPSFFFWPAVYLDKAEVSKRLVRRYPKLEKLGEIADIITVGQSNYGKFSRLTRVKLVGADGKSDFLRAEDFRLSVDPTGQRLKSTIFQIKDMGNKWVFFSGRGCGHGVGMCQCGAQGMARAGETAEQILSYYYPRSKIVSIY